MPESIAAGGGPTAVGAGWAFLSAGRRIEIITSLYNIIRSLREFSVGDKVEVRHKKGHVGKRGTLTTDWNIAQSENVTQTTYGNPR